ncbi:FAD-dependent monooxygenase (plasmid) [Tistrella mobilis]|uniref:FAD-dependent monooxygenase n=1 Tax=Tistrella mobilis TaxID=171437 RepID=UPI003557BD14
MKIAIVGGGPAGLFFARLIKRSRPDAEVRVFEQNPRDATYGFGVVLAGTARDRLREVDPETLDRLARAMTFSGSQKIGLNGDSLVLTYPGSSGAIARLTLLQILGRLCDEVGVEVVHDRRITGAADLDGYDLIVGADGANSVIRTIWPEAFPVRSHQLGNRFAWYGVDRALRPNALIFRYHRGGCFIAHYYTYADGLSTFVAECDAATWEGCGLDRMTDGQRKALIEEIYADVLDGGRLLDNNSIWRRFDARIAERWTDGRAVLIGDALRVAHFSIGSGTRLAMDDAVALHDALIEGGPVTRALDRYVAARRPVRDLFTEATARSYDWYEGVRQAMQTDLVSFVHDFLTRTGRVDDDRLKEYAPEFYARHIAPRRAQDAGLELTA